MNEKYFKLLDRISYCKSIRSLNIYQNGIRLIRMAFSCTCQPNIKEQAEHITTERRKVILASLKENKKKIIDFEHNNKIYPILWKIIFLYSHGAYRLIVKFHNFHNMGIIAATVSTNVAKGLTVGKTAWSYSCTRPEVNEAVEFVSTFNTLEATLSAVL